MTAPSLLKAADAYARPFLTRTDDATLLIGGRPLADVLAAAAAEGSHDHARAWLQLLGVDWSHQPNADLFRAYVQRHTRGFRWHELRALFAMIAGQNPGLVCDLFPRAADPFALSLCGAEGLRVALHELQSRDRDRRDDAAFALVALVDAGVEVPRQPLLEALAREWCEDVRETIGLALRAVEAGSEGR